VLVELNSDRWKSAVHDALTGTPGLTIWRAQRNADHLSYAKHLTAERKVEEHVAGKGLRTRWETEGRRPNHWLDATALAMAAARTLLDERNPGEAQSAPAARPVIRQTGKAGPIDYRGKW
jgi:hypothetical protein